MYMLQYTPARTWHVLRVTHIIQENIYESNGY